MSIELKLIREYFTHGTNGILSVDDKFHSHTIELPWKDNAHQISCIPEGRYKLVKHYSGHLGEVVILMNVPNRDMIYIHPANDALKELLGCIAPVTTIIGEGKGSASKAVFEPLKEKIYAAIDNHQECWITITTAAKPETAGSITETIRQTQA